MFSRCRTRSPARSPRHCGSRYPRRNRKPSRRNQPKISRPTTSTCVGKSYARRLQRQDLEFALQMFENAVILDPNFALAYAAIANVCAQNHYNYGRDPVWMERAMKASQTAVVLRPDLPEVQVAQAWILYANNKYDEAVAVVQKAIDRKRDPSKRGHRPV